MRSAYRIRRAAPGWLIPLVACGGSSTEVPDVATVTAITVTALTDELSVGQSLKIEAHPVDGTGNDVSGVTVLWSSSNPAVAAVVSTGSTTALITAADTGMATVDATIAAPDTLRGNLAVHVEVARWAAVSAGALHACALSLTQGVYCWGINAVRQAGVGTPSAPCGPSAVPACVLEPTAVSGGHLFLRVDASGSLTCGVAAETGLLCWGMQPNMGLTSATSTPLRAPPVDPSITAASGGNPACAVTASGRVWCWGGSHNGALGDGNTAGHVSGPVDVPLSVGARSIAAAEHVCIVAVDNSAWCWGANNSGALGVASAPSVCQHFFTANPVPCAARPVRVETSTSFTAIDVGEIPFGAGSTYDTSGHSCGLSASGEILCWGTNETGALGSNVSGTCTTGRSNLINFLCSRSPTAVAGNLTYSALAVGNGFACGVTTAGDTYCWGSGYGQSPQLVPGGETFQSITAGDTFACGVTPGNEVFCWGSNDWGQLGTGDFVGSSTPVRVVDP